LAVSFERPHEPVQVLGDLLPQLSLGLVRLLHIAKHEIRNFIAA